MSAESPNKSLGEFQSLFAGAPKFPQSAALGINL